MSIFLIIFAFLECLILLYALERDIRVALVKTWVLLFLVLLFATEAFSLFSLVTRLSFMVFWSVVSVLGLVLLIRNRTAVRKQIGDGLRSWAAALKKHSRDQFFFVIGVAMILTFGGLTLLISLQSPPNNFDSMTYHMARVVHWIQNQSVRFYPTAIPRQNYSMPLAEYAVLHFQLLSGSDQFANLVQWSSYGILILLASKFGQLLGFGKRGELLAAFLSAVIPMAVLQSSSTQNDLVVSLFCLIFVFFLIQILEDFSWEGAFFTGISLGLALYTKGTAYVFCAAMGVALSLYYLVGRSWAHSRRIILRLALVVVLGLVINGAHYSRNLALYRHPLSQENGQIINQEVSIRTFWENLVRNSAVHLSTPSPSGNKYVMAGVSSLLAGQVNRQVSTFPDTEFEVTFDLNGDNSGNLLHFILLIPTVIWTAATYQKRKKSEIGMLLALLLSVIFFNTLIRWQPWGSRLQLPIFYMGSILSANFIDKIRWRWIGSGFILVLFFVYSLPFLFLNPSRPILPVLQDEIQLSEQEWFRKLALKFEDFLEDHPEMSQTLDPYIRLFEDSRSVLYTNRNRIYFYTNFEYYYDYLDAARKIRSYSVDNIGLLMDNNDWEYPLWVFLGKHYSPGPPLIEHILVENKSRDLEQDTASLPEVVVNTSKRTVDILNASGYEIVFETEKIQVFAQPGTK